MSEETTHQSRSLIRNVFRFIFWPVRHWLFSIFVIAGLIVAYQVAVYRFQTRLDALHAAAKAAGEFTRTEDFQVNDLNDANNAAIVYRRAQSQFTMPEGADFDNQEIWSRYTASKTDAASQEPKQGRGEAKPVGPLTPEEEALVDTYIASNGSAYEAIREASKRPLCQFGDYRIPSKVIEGMPFQNDLKITRALGRTIALRAVWEARHGNTDAAYEWIGHGLHLANNLRNEPLIINGLVRIAIAEMILRSLETIMGETPWTGKLPDGFEQELVQIGDRTLFARCLEGERFFAEAYQSRWDNFLNLMAVAMQYALYKAQSGVIAAVREPDYTKRQERIAEVERYLSLNGKTGSSDSDTHSKELTGQMRPGQKFFSYKILAQITVSAQLAAIEAFNSAEIHAQNARQALALKRYKQAHGQYPDQLQQILSGEFKELPRDSFNGEPFHYKKEGDGFLLYSVGRNGIDDGGQPGFRTVGDIVWRVTQ